jgi:hypothetical protein
MANLGDFIYTDGIDTVHAKHVNDLLAATLRAEYRNEETLSADRALLDADTPIQVLTPDAANRAITLPAADDDNHAFHIVNASSVYSLTLTGFDSILPGKGAILAPMGAGWRMFSDASTKINTSGWTPVFDTWTRTGNHSFAVAGDVTAIYEPGVKLRYKDGGAFEYGVVATSAHAAGTTTVTLLANTSYAMADVAITDRWISRIRQPAGWPEWFSYANFITSPIVSPQSGIRMWTTSDTPAGWSWAGAPFETPEIILNTNNVFGWRKLPSGTGRAYLYTTDATTIANAVDLFCNFSFSGFDNGFFGGVRLDDGTDDNYVEVGWRWDTSGIPNRIAYYHRAGGGAVTDGVYSQLDTAIIPPATWVGVGVRGVKWTNWDYRVHIVGDARILIQVASSLAWTPTRVGITTRNPSSEFDSIRFRATNF